MYIYIYIYIYIYYIYIYIKKYIYIIQNGELMKDFRRTANPKRMRRSWMPQTLPDI